MFLVSVCVNACMCVSVPHVLCNYKKHIQYQLCKLMSLSEIPVRTFGECI
jgi:hypothetical protein